MAVKSTTGKFNFFGRIFGKKNKKKEKTAEDYLRPLPNETFDQKKERLEKAEVELQKKVKELKAKAEEAHKASKRASTMNIIGGAIGSIGLFTLAALSGPTVPAIPAMIFMFGTPAVIFGFDLKEKNKFNEANRKLDQVQNTLKQVQNVQNQSKDLKKLRKKAEKLFDSFKKDPDRKIPEVIETEKWVDVDGVKLEKSMKKMAMIRS